MPKSAKITPELNTESKVLDLTDSTKDTPLNPEDLISKENVALTSFINKILELKKHWELKNKFTIEDYDVRPRILTPDEDKTLAEKITSEFKKKNLHKGATEVFNAIAYVDLKSTQSVYIAGYLDLAYEEALIKSITQVHRKVNVIRLDKSYRSLVYNCVKDVNFKKIERLKSRRAFNCRIFLV